MWQPRTLGRSTAPLPSSFSFFFNDTATTEIYTLSLHDALPIFHELEINPEVLALEQGNCGLQLVLALALHPHLIALDLSLDFQLPVLDDPRDVLRLLAREPVLDLRDLPDRPAQRRLHWAERERPHRHVALDEPGLQDIHHALELVLVVRHEHQLALLLLERQLRPGSLEVEPLVNLLQRLIEGVLDFLHLHFRDHIERIHVSHATSPLTVPFNNRVRPES